MERGETDGFDWDDLDDLPCLTRDECLSDLLREAPANCLYCRLADLDDGDDE